MGSLHPSSSAPPPDGAAGVPVVLNVYDLTPMNDYMSWFGIGIFHSGIEAHGLEYGFGAHDLPASGVFEVEPKSCPGFVYRCSVRLGHTEMLPSEFRAFIENIAADYHGDTYHLITKNCNHFTNDVALRVTGTPIPGWVNRLAQLGAVCNCLLPESLRVPAVKQTPEYHGRFDGGESCSINSPELIIYLEDGGESRSINSPEPTDSDEEKHLLTPSSGGEVVFIKEAQR